MREELKKILMKVWMEACDSRNPHNTIDEALSAIVEEIRKVVPKEKDLSGMFQVDCVYRPPLKDGDKIDSTYINYEQRIGYNQYRTELLQILDALAKDGEMGKGL